MKKNGKNLTFYYEFLGVTLLIYLIIWFVNPNLFYKSINQFASIFLKLLPILIAVYFFIFLTNAFIKPDKVKKYIGKDSGFKGTIISIAFGIISTGSIYVWYPFIKELREHGMTNKNASIFLYNRAVKLHLLPIMIGYFGIDFTIVLTFLIVSFSVIVGISLEKLIILFDKNT